MKKILLFIMAMGVMATASRADESLQDKMLSMLHEGQSIEQVFSTFSGDYGAVNVLGGLAFLAPEQLQSVLDLASEKAPSFVPVLVALHNVDSKVVRMDKPEHRQEHHAGQEHQGDQASNNEQFDPNALPASAAGGEDNGNVQLASLDDPNSGDATTVSP